MPRAEDCAEEQNIQEVIACFDRPNLEAMPGKQFVYKISRRNESKPNHETCQRTRGCGCTSHQVDQQCNRYGLNKCGYKRENINHWVGVTRLTSFANALPPGR